jgi:hypothetical protein
MTGRSLTIAFGSHQVSVSVDCPILADQIELWFRAMLVLAATPDPEPLRVSAKLNGYRLRDSAGLDRRFSDSSRLLLALKYEVVTRLIAAHPHLLWFHAGAIAQANRGLLLASPSGGGKSTLTTRLCQHGWRYLSDDAVPLDLQTGMLLPFPQTPRVRSPIKQQVSSKQLATLPKTEIVLTSDRLCLHPVPLSGILFPGFSPSESAHLVPLSPTKAMLNLLQNCINFTQHKETAIAALCRFIQRCPAASLNFSDANDAIACLTSWWKSQAEMISPLIFGEEVSSLGK